MSQYVVTALLNTRSRFEPFTPGDTLEYDLDLVLTVDAPTSQHAASLAFEIGNRMRAGIDGHTWPSWARSLSVGDVVIVNGFGDDRAVYAVEEMGFKAVTREQIGETWNRAGGRARMAAAGHARAED